MKVVSFNVLCWGSLMHSLIRRKPLVVKMLRKLQPDTFGLQEAHWDWMSYVIKNMPEYDYVGVGRDDGKKKGEFSPVFYRKDKYEVLSGDTFWLSETPDTPSKGWDGACTRVCSYAELRDKETGRVFIHMNTHLDHIGPVAMIEGAKLIGKRAEQFGDTPIVLTGDFNVTPDSGPYNAIIAAGFTDTARTAPDTDEGITYHGFEKPGVGAFIDFVFVKNGVKADSYKIIRDKIDSQLPSDHYPVTATVELP